MKRTLIFLLTLTLAASLAAQVAPSITPNAGSTAGGDVVLIKGDFGTWPPSVRFGYAMAPQAERLDATTIRVVTPPHLPGTVGISLFDYDMWLDTQLTFTFAGEVPVDALERVLLPIFTAPVRGGYGSEFRSALSVMNRSHEQYVLGYGLTEQCLILCPQIPFDAFELAPTEELTEHDLDHNGNPGRFIYLPQDKRDEVVLQLRAYDVSREAANFGTQIPVARGTDLRADPVTLLGIPTDPRFRNTLRIYSVGASAFAITIETADGARFDHSTYAPAGASVFEPAYAVFTDFPTDAGPVRVTITQLLPIVSPPAHPTQFWAFNSVTNNETQHITVISPQR